MLPHELCLEFSTSIYCIFFAGGFIGMVILHYIKIVQRSLPTDCLYAYVMRIVYSNGSNS